MEIGVSTHRAQLGHAALFDGDPAGEVLVAVEQAGGPVQRVSRVVDGRTFRYRVSSQEHKSSAHSDTGCLTGNTSLVHIPI